MSEEKLTKIFNAGIITSEDNIKLEDLSVITSSGNTFLREIVSRNVIVLDEKLLKSIANDYDLLLKMLKSCYIEWLALNEIDIPNELLMRMNNGKCLLDYIYCAGYTKVSKWSFKMFNKIKDDMEVVSVCCRCGRGFEYLNDEITNKILTCDKLRDWLNNIEFTKWFLQKYKYQEIVKVLEKYNLFKLLKYAPEEILLEKNRKGKTVLERLIKRKIDPEFISKNGKNSFEKQTTAEILVNLGRIDLLRYGRLATLLKNHDDSNNYFQMLVDYNMANNKKIDMEKVLLSEPPFNVDIVSKCLIILMKSGDFDYFNMINEKKEAYFLAFCNKANGSLLSYLIAEDRELVVKNLKVKKIRIAEELLRFGVDNFTVTDLKVALELKRRGIDNFIYDEENNYSLKTGFGDLDIANKALILFNNNYCNDVISPVEDKLQRLKELFLQDGKSKEELVETLIISYRYATSFNEEMIKELDQLIKIKENNMDQFLIEEILGDSKFCKKICMEGPLIKVINHEVGHALHYYLADYTVPDELSEAIDRRLDSKEFYDEVKKISSGYYENKEKADDYASQYFEKYWLLVSEDEEYSSEKVHKYFSDKVRKVSEVATQMSYPMEMLMELLDNIPSKEEIIARKEVVERKELAYYIFLYYFDPNNYYFIGDVIDGISQGKFYEGQLLDKKNKSIRGTSGHGEKYYSLNNDNVFIEMVANYSAIIKSKDASEGLERLKAVLGKELFEMIRDFYNNNIIHSDKYVVSKGISK